MDAREPRGAALCAPIDSIVRADGKIVVWQEAAADVSTAMIKNLSKKPPRTSPPVAESTSSAFLTRNAAPWTACAANAVITSHGVELHRKRGGGHRHTVEAVPSFPGSVQHR